MLVVIINTILCLLGIVPAFGIQLATVMGGAAVGAGPLGGFLAVAGFFFPAMPIISIIGSWIAYIIRVHWLAVAFVILPWAYLLVLGVGLGIFFWQGSQTPS